MCRVHDASEDVSSMLDGIEALTHRYFVWKASRRPPAREPTEEEKLLALKQWRAEKKQEELRVLPKWIINMGRENEDYLASFANFWIRVSAHLSYITREEAEPIFDVYAPKVLAAIQAKKARRERMRRFIIFWVNFSRIFIKGVLNLFYLALFAGVVYTTVTFGLPALKATVEGILWAFTHLVAFDWLGALILAGTWGLRLSIGAFTVGSIGWMLHKFVPFHLLWQKTAPPFVAFGNLIVALAGYFKAIVSNVFDFICLFYEENCPPITIVNDTEAKIAAIEEETE